MIKLPETFTPDSAGTWQTVGRGLLVWWFLIAGLWYALTSLLTIANFAWPQLAFDQFRIYTSSLGITFPENVMVPENGHRPVIPALVRIAEIHAFSANQYLQIGFGTLCATLAATTIALTAWREKGMTAPMRAAAVLFALVGIFWLGNARMLLHGNEATGIYLVILCAVAGALMVRRGVAEGSWGWMVGAALMGVTATFCFAAGVSLFPTFLILAWLLRAHWRHVFIILAAAVLCAALYLFVLSGDGGVRSSLGFRPLDSLIFAARWLASPWITGWLGFADPQTHEIVLNTPLGLALKQSATLLQGLLHFQWRTTGATLIGMAGLLALAAGVMAKARRRGPMAATTTIALALMLFAAATGGLIGIGRLSYLDQNPDQIFADRYLVWGCLFWMGTALLLLMIATRRGPWLRNAMLAFAALLPIALLPFHQYGAGWGEAVYHLNQAAAAGAMSDVFDDRLFQDNADATLEQRVLSYRLMRERNLGPFRFDGTTQLGNTIGTTPLATPPDVSVQIDKMMIVADARDGSVGAHFEGHISAGIRAVRARGPLAVIDPSQRIVGYALFSHVGTAMPTLSLSLPIKCGFEGYVKNYDPAIRYRLLSIDANGVDAVAWELAKLPAPTP